MIKFENIIKFLSIFLSGDLNLTQESPDYIIEKFERYFGTNIEIKQHNKTSKLYKKHNEIWNHDDYRINSIFNFFLDVLQWSKQSDIKIVWNGSPFNSGINNILCEPETLVELFNDNIGNFSDIYNVKGENTDGLHRVIYDNLYSVYLDSVEKENYFKKLERKEKLIKINRNE